ncbi:MAG: hypothetical protein NT062_09605 [Proteobacteria bacterium]|nr:hypothetical protein [Pseudomonadota bacterium]
MSRGALVAACLCLGATTAHAGYLARLATAVQDRLDAAVMAHAPVHVPPTQVAVTWKPVRLASVELGAPLLAIGGADLDGDGRGELYALTTREVVAFAMTGGRLVETGRAALVGELAVPRSRDAFGALRDEGATSLVANASPIATPMRVTWKHQQLVVEAAPGVDPTCLGGAVQPTPGRNVLALKDVGPIYAARCRELVDAAGAPVVGKAILSATTAKLAVTILPGGSAHEFTLVGATFELADVDRDGHLEVIIAGAGPAGDVDAVKVMTFPDDKPVFRKPFTGGVVGITTLDEGVARPLAVIVAVRLVGATRVDLWRLD